MKGVERLKGTAKGIDLASFMAEHRTSDEVLNITIGGTWVFIRPKMEP